MNLPMIRFYLGRLFLFLAGLLLLPLLVSLLYQEGWQHAFSYLATIGLLLALSFASQRRPPEVKRMYAREGFVLCAFSWLALSLFGSLPFIFSGEIPNLIDAFFETASGFTTTGASILVDVEAMAHSHLFWRSLTHVVGGMGVLVFVLAILPNAESDSSSVHIMRAEVPGPIFGKLLSRVKDISRTLYLIYLSMTVVVILLLLLGGMNLFDACIHAFGAAGTGGFSSRSASVGAYHSPYIEIVLGVSMLLFGVNFNLYYLLLLRQVRAVFKDEELRWYLGIVLSAIGLLSAGLWFYYNDHALMLRDIFFTVTSLMTTTGFSTVDYNQWPLFAHVILLLLMMVGSCAGSTAGGIKVSRVAILWKGSRREFLRTLSPNRLVPLHFNQKRISPQILGGIQAYFSIYVLVFTFLTLVVSFDSPDFSTAFSAVAATLNNIGPGLSMVGPTGNFAHFTLFTKFLLSFSMLIGRLEILPVLLLFNPGTWRRG